MPGLILLFAAIPKISIDVSLAHPRCSDVISNAAWLHGAAALRREEKKKIDKYKQEKLPGASSLDLVPLLFKHYGHWDSEAERFLYKTSQHQQSRNEDGKIITNRQRLAHELQRLQQAAVGPNCSAHQKERFWTYRNLLNFCVCFLSSWAFSVHKMWLQFPSLDLLIKEIAHPNQVEGSAGHELHQALPSNKTTLDLADHSLKLRHKLTAEFSNAKGPYRECSIQ